MQIEVTNRCNFNCQMYIRRVWNTKPLNMNLDLYNKIAETNFPNLKRILLYGLGEPFVNQNILKMLRIARKQLPEDAQIILSTNGSLLSYKLADKIVRYIGVDSISFSIDTIDEAKFSRIREGSKPSAIMKNFRHIAKIKGYAKRKFKLGIEAAIMEDNFRDLPNLIEGSAKNNVDYIIVSHVIPYTEEVLMKSLYITLSKPSFEIIKPSLKYGRSLIHKASQEFFIKTYGLAVKAKSSNIIKKFWENAEKNGYWINLPLLFNLKDKIKTITKVEEIFRKSEKIAYEYQVDLKLPNLYPDAGQRKCPYVEGDTLVIRSDGLAVPCLEFMYPHSMYVNAHPKNINETLFGDLKRETIGDIWKKKVYVNFRRARKNMEVSIPLCGDCPYLTLGCYYTRANEFDCYGNEYTCNECLYSVHLAQCNL